MSTDDDASNTRQRKYEMLQSSRERRARMQGRHIDDDDPNDSPDLLAAFVRKSRLASSVQAKRTPKKQRKANTATHRWCSGCELLLLHARFKEIIRAGEIELSWRCTPCERDYHRKKYKKDTTADQRALSRERQRRYRERKKQASS